MSKQVYISADYATDAKHHASCVSPYLLLQYGESRDESENTPVPHGAFRQRSDHEHLHPPWLGGC